MNHVVQMECELEVVGVTAIEDKLQDDVANTIADLSKAGAPPELYAAISISTTLDVVNLGSLCLLYPL